MMIRCAARTLGGAVLLSGLAAAATVAAGGIGAALLAKRLWEERKGWRDGASATDPMPEAMGEPAPEAPSA